MRDVLQKYQMAVMGNQQPSCFATNRTSQPTPVSFSQYSIPINNLSKCSISITNTNSKEVERAWNRFTGKILITEYLGYCYLTYHHPQHLHLAEKTEKGTMIINTVLWYNRYICNFKLTLSFQQPSESKTAFGNATLSVV